MGLIMFLSSRKVAVDDRSIEREPIDHNRNDTPHYVCKYLEAKQESEELILIVHGEYTKQIDHPRRTGDAEKGNPQ